MNAPVSRCLKLKVALKKHVPVKDRKVERFLRISNEFLQISLADSADGIDIS